MATATATRTPKEPAAVSPAKLGPIGPAIDKMFDLREQKRELEAKVSKIEAEYALLEGQLMEKMASEGTDKAAGKKAGVSVTTSVVTNVTDWDAFEKYVKRTGYFQLYQRRVSEPAVREVLEKKGSVPGTEPFTKRKLNLRVI